MHGYPSRTYYDEINVVTNNSAYEVYASEASFPSYFRYNAIIDEDNAGNPSDPMVYYDTQGGGLLVVDAQYNWRGNNFISSQDLYPSIFDTTNFWCPSGGWQNSSETVLQAYQDAMGSFDLSVQKEGQNHFELNMQNTPKGLYFYSIYVNGTLCGSKKTIMDASNVWRFMQINDVFIVKLVYRAIIQ